MVTCNIIKPSQTSLWFDGKVSLYKYFQREEMQLLDISGALFANYSHMQSRDKNPGHERRDLRPLLCEVRGWDQVEDKEGTKN